MHRGKCRYNNRRTINHWQRHRCLIYDIYSGASQYSLDAYKLKYAWSADIAFEYIFSPTLCCLFSQEMRKNRKNISVCPYSSNEDIAASVMILDAIWLKLWSICGGRFRHLWKIQPHAFASK